MHPLLIILGVAVVLLTGPVPGHADGLLPELPRGKGEQCVEPTDVMRRQHMDFLFHQRDETMYAGVRTKRHSLVECVDCHAQQNADGEFIAVNAPGQFCAACHAFTATRIDCFECHAARPYVGADDMADRGRDDKRLAGQLRHFLDTGALE